MELLASSYEKMTIELTRLELLLLLQRMEPQRKFIPEYRHEMEQFRKLFESLYYGCYDQKQIQVMREDLASYKQQLDREHAAYVEKLKKCMNGQESTGMVIDRI